MTKQTDLGRTIETIEKDLNSVVKNSKKEPITVEVLLKSLAGKGYPLLAILFSLPFCQPLQIPGFSVPFGIVILFIGLRMAFGRRLWWPQWVLKKEISPKAVTVIAQKVQWMMEKLNKILRPRLSWLSQGSIMHILNGIMIAIIGAFLAIPFPIPLSNIVAAWSIILISLGVIGKDGVFIGIGYLLALACFALIVFIVVVSARLIMSA